MNELLSAAFGSSSLLSVLCAGHLVVCLFFFFNFLACSYAIGIVLFLSLFAMFFQLSGDTTRETETASDSGTHDRENLCYLRELNPISIFAQR